LAGTVAYDYKHKCPSTGLVCVRSRTFYLGRADGTHREPPAASPRTGWRFLYGDHRGAVGCPATTRSGSAHLRRWRVWASAIQDMVQTVRMHRPMLRDSGGDVTVLPHVTVAPSRLDVIPGTGYEVERFGGGVVLASAAQAEMSSCGQTFRGRFMLIEQE
jgi:hypothetical protein